jgi:2-polyprenyl-6-methoxyphenol hydroxylase-like FAD-dependent oxidoreductase
MSAAPELDVLVVGAGPTGLTLAAELARRGVGVRIIDKIAEPTTLSKAIVIHARTLELLEADGVADDLVSRGLPLYRVTMWAGGKPIVKASFDELDTRYAFLLSVSQAETEAALAAWLGRYSGKVEREVELEGFTQTETQVVAQLRTPGGPEEVRARYIVGCDGARSAVRKSLGLGFTGSTYDERFLLADVRLQWDEPADEMASFFAEDGLIAVFPMRGGRVRIIGTCEPGDVSEEAPTLEHVLEVMRRRSQRDVQLSDPAWLARFRIHCRQVERYRLDRAFLAGDAAHIHSPAGGQGMNTGIQDAHNLAWKLALAVKSRATEQLLDSYGIERHAVGEAVLRSTDFATKVGTVRGVLARNVRNTAARFMSSFEFVQQRIVKQVSELTVGYEASPIVGQHHVSMLGARVVGSEKTDERPSLPAWRHFEAGPKPGTFAPDGHARFAEGDPASGELTRLHSAIDRRLSTLLLFDGRASTEAGYEKLVAIATRVLEQFPRLIDVLLITPAATRPPGIPPEVRVVLDVEGDLEHRYGAEAECLFLLRPDGYIGFRSQPAEMEPLERHLEEIFFD